MTDNNSVQPTTRVPEQETPAPRCPYCDRPFPRVELRTLHVGNVHPDRCTDEEQAAFEAAADEESDDLFLYHIKVISTLMMLYASLVIVYMVVLSA